MQDSSNALFNFSAEADEDFKVEFELVPAFEEEDFNSERKRKIRETIADIETQEEQLNTTIEELNSKIDKLTNHADTLDYAIAVTSGVICGLIDSIFVGEWNFEKAKAISNEKINKKVIEFAKKKGFKGERLAGAISFLENKYPLPGDGAFNVAFENTPDELKNVLFNSEGKHTITTYSHHLDDFCHHPTLIGLICCLIVQFSESTIYSNSKGELIRLPIEVNRYGQLQGKNPYSMFFCGIINWFMNVAGTMANAHGHWMSDIAGSHTAKHGGMGLPGSVMSVLKELSSLPFMKDSNFTKNVNNAFLHGIGTGKNQVDLGAFNALFEGASSKVDYRTELAVKLELKRQSIPVIINDVLVRSFYFIRRLTSELKTVDSIKDISWNKVVPFNNRTIIRMLTIATGTFTAFDLADAAIHAAVEGGSPTTPLFWRKFVLRVNFVGVGRFFIAVASDIGMGIRRNQLIKKRMLTNDELIQFKISKVYFLQENMWLTLEETEAEMEKLYKIAGDAVIAFDNNWQQISSSLQQINDIDNDKIEKNNPSLLKDLSNIIEWS